MTDQRENTSAPGTAGGKTGKKLPIILGSIAAVLVVLVGSWYYYANNGSQRNKTYSDGVYTGELKMGQREGERAYTFANGDVYTGSWTDDHMNGFGKMIYANGDVYEYLMDMLMK